MMRILVADDHFMVRRGLRQLLEERVPGSSVDEAADGNEALSRVAERHYDLVILDYSMPGREGLDLLRDLKDADPDTHILVLTILPEEQYALRAFKLGASGCANKDIDPEELLAAIKTVASGQRYLSRKAGALLLGDLAGGDEEPHRRLSDREFQILRMIASGQSVGDIAARLCLSVKTVSTYRARLLEKMKMESNAQLMHYAFRHGIAGTGA